MRGWKRRPIGPGSREAEGQVSAAQTMDGPPLGWASWTRFLARCLDQLARVASPDSGVDPVGHEGVVRLARIVRSLEEPPKAGGRPLFQEIGLLRDVFELWRLEAPEHRTFQMHWTADASSSWRVRAHSVLPLALAAWEAASASAEGGPVILSVASLDDLGVLVELEAPGKATWTPFEFRAANVWLAEQAGSSAYLGQTTIGRNTRFTLRLPVSTRPL